MSRTYKKAKIKTAKCSNKLTKETIKSKDSYLEYLDVLENHIYDHAYYYSGTGKGGGQIYPHSFGEDYYSELEKAGIEL